jgi:hypothetical protein
VNSHNLQSHLLRPRGTSAIASAGRHTQGELDSVPELIAISLTLSPGTDGVSSAAARDAMNISKGDKACGETASANFLLLRTVTEL